jgi:hypothetical protein
VLGYGFTLLVVGVLIPFQSLINTESLAMTITQRIERVDLGWAEKQNKAYIAGTIGRVVVKLCRIMMRCLLLTTT